MPDEMKNKDYKKKIIVLIIFLSLCLIYAIWEYQLQQDVLKEGVFSKCVIMDAYGKKGGANMVIKYSLNGKTYQPTQSCDVYSIKIGSQYFIKVKPENPELAIVLENDPVPDCLLNVSPPDEGWKELPTCDSLPK